MSELLPQLLTALALGLLTLRRAALQVGAGISGLCTAQALRSSHGDAVGSVLVTEARERVGGNGGCTCCGSGVSARRDRNGTQARREERCC